MKLNIKKRDVFGKKTKLLRKEWIVPWVIYWRHEEKSLSVSFNKIEFLKIYREAWESTPIDLSWDWITKLALIYDVKTNPVTDQLIHVDFLSVKADEKVETEVPIKLTGESEVEKAKLWKVEQIKYHVLVEALPRDLPHDIAIDISSIKTVNDVIFLKDIVVSSKVEIKENLDLPVVTVSTLDEEEEETQEWEVSAAWTAWADKDAEWDKKEAKKDSK